MIDNVIPYIGGEEEKSEQEPLKIWGEIINGKIVDAKYYRELGQIAYSHLNGLVPDLLEIPSFYSVISESFQSRHCRVVLSGSELTDSSVS